MALDSQVDQPRLEVESSGASEVRLRSGLGMLGAKSTIQTEESDQAALARLRARVGATHDTWRQWRGVRQFRAREGLALHHHLDPAALGMSEAGNSLFRALMQEYAALPNSPLEAFATHLVSLDCYIRNGRLPCVQMAQPATSSVVTVEEFSRFMEGQPVFDFGSAVGAETSLAAAPRSRHMTPLMQAVLGAGALYQTVDEGGGYVPGVHHTCPDVQSYLNSLEIEGLSGNLIGAICTIVRPTELKKGRPPKLRQHSGN